MPRTGNARSLLVSGGVLLGVIAGIVPSDGATIDLPVGEGAPPATSRTVILSVDDAAGVLGTDLVITWDPAVVQADLVTQGSVASGHTLTYNLGPGIARISLYGTSPLTGGGSLIEITFEAIGPPGAFTVLDISSAALNEGAIVSTMNDGDFCVQAAPPPVTPLSVVKLPATTIASLSWQSVPYATSYNVYRGAGPDPAGLACFLSGVSGISAQDDGLVPPLGQMFLYAVTSSACSGESSLGLSSSGAPRPQPTACP